MYTEQQVLDMSSEEFGDLLRRLGKDELVSLLHYVRGYEPRAVASALSYRDAPRATCGKRYVAAGDGEVRACQRQPHDTGDHWVYEDDWRVHMGHAAPPAINGDRHPAPAVALAPVAEEVAEP